MGTYNFEIKKTKGFYYFMFLYFLFATSLDMFSQKVYQEKDGIVMMEAENTATPLNLWITSSYFPTYSGTGHLEFSGGVVTGAGSPLSPIEYKFKINESGDYALNIRGRSRLLVDEPQDWANDAWFKVVGDYTVGTNGPPDISWMNTFTKIFVGRGGNGDWGWGTNYDRNHVQPKAIFNFKAGETYTLTMAGRSQRFNVDRILLAKTSIANHISRAITTESEWIDDGTVVERYRYDGLYHFSNINAGEVNYYKDDVRGALAIDASVIADRDKFAKAETTFTGKSGTYNIILKTLAEFDGECTYQFLVNGNVVGTYTNSAVDENNDYKEQTVIFEAIDINENDMIAVASNTHTNGLIPEGNSTAWARGRWKRVSMIPTTYQGRVAVVADGNYRDSDDIAGTPISLAILSALGLEGKLVHYSHSCDLVQGANDPGGAFREAEMQTSCDGTASRFGNFDHITFFNCQNQKAEAISDLKDKINDSSEINPLWIIEAGEPDIIWEAVNAAESSKREFIYMVTHHPANDRGDTYNLSDVMALGIPTENLKSIPDQNALLKKTLSDWYWARDHTDSRINWLWDRGFIAQSTAMNYPAIVGKFDCSDAGMIYYWATIKSGGDFSCDVPKLKNLFLDYIPVIPPFADFKTPLNGAILETGSNIEVEANLAINASEIQSIELLIDDVSVSILTQAPFIWNSNTQLENMVEGTYVLKLKTTKTTSEISTATITIEVKTPVVQEPYGGTPHKIPGIIEGENYDLGGQSVGYNDTTDGNTGGKYREDNVDLGEVASDNYNVGWTVGGEWLEYTVDVEEDGVYDLDVTYASNRSGGGVKIGAEFFDENTTLFTSFDLPVTGGWSTYQTLTKSEITLIKGIHILRINIEGAGCNLDKLQFKKSSTASLDESTQKKTDVLVYPVPSKEGKFHLSKTQIWKVYSLLGKELLSGNGTFIDISKFAKGVYILKTENKIDKRLVYN